jgi:hypothetical protein
MVLARSVLARTTKTKMGMIIQRQETKNFVWTVVKASHTYTKKTGNASLFAQLDNISSSRTSIHGRRRQANVWIVKNHVSSVDGAEIRTIPTKTHLKKRRTVTTQTFPH